MIITEPVARSTGNVHQMTGRKRSEKRASGWSLPRNPIHLRSIMRTEDRTAAIDRMWTVCTAGTIHSLLWIVWLKGVCSSHEQKSSSARVRIGIDYGTDA